MPDKVVEKVLCPSMEGVGVALAQGSWREVAAAVMKSVPLRTIVTELILNTIRAECTHLCGHGVSLLHKSTPQDLKAFRWEAVIEEWKREAPLFHAFLFAVAAPPRPRNVIKVVDITSRYPAICMGGAMLLKERNACMSAIHYLSGIILFHGDCKKQVIIIITINKHCVCVCVCVCPTRSIMHYIK